MSRAGYYVVVRNGERTRALFGPLETQEGAASYVENARPLMRGWAHFYELGVARYERRDA